MPNKRKNNRNARNRPKRKAQANPRQRQARVERVSRAATVSRVIRNSTAARPILSSGTEALGEVSVQPNPGSTITLSSGTVIYDCLVNPTILSGASSRLAALAGTYSNYRFAKLKLRVVSSLSTAMTGSVTWCITRDIDADYLGDASTNSAPTGYWSSSGALQYAQNAESNMTLPVWESKDLSISCQSRLNKQKFYDVTPGSELEEACQFRILGVIATSPGVVGSFTTKMSVQLFLDYTIELASPQGVESRIAPVTILSGGILTVAGVPTEHHLTGVTLPAAGVYLVNPAIPPYVSAAPATPGPPYPPLPIRGATVINGALGTVVPFSNPAAAEANADRANIFCPALGPFYLTSPVNFFYIKGTTYQSNPTFKLVPHLTDDDKTALGDFWPKLQKALASLKLVSDQSGINNSYNVNLCPKSSPASSGPPAPSDGKATDVPK